jgi:hypothetical protein
LIETLKKDLRPVRPLRPPWQYALALLLFGLAVSIGWIEVIDQAGWREIGLTSWLLMGGGLCLALASSAYAAAQWLSPTGRSSLLRSAIGFALALIGVTLATGTGDFSLALTAGCFSSGSVIAAIAALASFLTFRRAAPQRRERVALASGLFSGVLGFLLIQLHCPIRDPGHMLLGHAALPLAWAIASYTFIKLFSKA